MGIVAGDAFAFHDRRLIHRGLFVAGIADLFLGQGERDRRFVVFDFHDVADGAGVREIEVDGLSFGLLRVTGQALASFGQVRMIGGKGWERGEHKEEDSTANPETRDGAVPHRASPVAVKLTPATVFPDAR